MIIQANSLNIPLEDESIQCVITSVPYWGLRSYDLSPTLWGGVPGCRHEWAESIKRGQDGGKNSPKTQTKGQVNFQTTPDSTHAFCNKCGGWRGCYGLEPTPELYVEHTVEIFREVWRVMRPDATLWLNIGDCYASSPNGTSAAKTKANGKDDRTFRDKPFNTISKSKRIERGIGRWGGGNNPAGGVLKPKDLVGMPWRVALALQADGWYLRSDVIWAKPNPMPESVQGSHYSRHRVTIEEYESLLRLRDEESKNQNGASDLPRLSAGKIPDSQAPLPEKHKGSDNGQNKRGTRRRKGKEASIQPLQTGETQSGKILENRKGAGSPGEGHTQLQDEWEESASGIHSLSENKTPSRADRSKEISQSEIRINRKGKGEEASGLRTAAGGNNSIAPGDGRGLVRDFETAQEPVSLLREEEGTDSRPRDTLEQRRETREGKYRSGLQKLQLEKEGQDNPFALVDCPGCSKCEKNDGYILHMSAGRPTKSHEYIFLLTKSGDYYYDAEAVREKSIDGFRINPNHIPRTGRKAISSGIWRGAGDKKEGVERGSDWSETSYDENYKRNLRSVWTLATQPYSGAHFATFPEALPERCILAGTSACGCCPTCGAGWVREVEKHVPPDDVFTNRNAPTDGFVWSGYRREGVMHGSGQKLQKWRDENPVRTLGWNPACDCPPAAPVPARVLDPFCGSGTTVQVARSHGRLGIGLDLSMTYLREQALPRAEKSQTADSLRTLPLFGGR